MFFLGLIIASNLFLVSLNLPAMYEPSRNKRKHDSSTDLESNKRSKSSDIESVPMDDIIAGINFKNIHQYKNNFEPMRFYDQTILLARAIVLGQFFSLPSSKIDDREKKKRSRFVLFLAQDAFLKRSNIGPYFNALGHLFEAGALSSNWAKKDDQMPMSSRDQELYCFHSFFIAAAAEDALGQYKLAELYFNKQAFDENQKQADLLLALRLLKASAEQGYAPSLCALGFIHDFMGFAVQAEEFFSLAKERKHPYAHIYIKGTQDQKSLEYLSLYEMFRLKLVEKFRSLEPEVLLEVMTHDEPLNLIEDAKIIYVQMNNTYTAHVESAQRVYRQNYRSQKEDLTDISSKLSRIKQNLDSFFRAAIINNNVKRIQLVSEYSEPTQLPFSSPSSRSYISTAVQTLLASVDLHKNLATQEVRPVYHVPPPVQLSQSAAMPNYVAPPALSLPSYSSSQPAFAEPPQSVAMPNYVARPALSLPSYPLSQPPFAEPPQSVAMPNYVARPAASLPSYPLSQPVFAEPPQSVAMPNYVARPAASLPLYPLSQPAFAEPPQSLAMPNYVAPPALSLPSYPLSQPAFAEPPQSAALLDRDKLIESNQELKSKLDEMQRKLEEQEKLIKEQARIIETYKQQLELRAPAEEPKESHNSLFINEYFFSEINEIDDSCLLNLPSFDEY